MTITQDRLDEIVWELENFSQQQPRQYKLRVRLLAILGYAYIFIVLFGLVGLLTGAIWCSIWLISTMGMRGMPPIIVGTVISLLLLLVMVGRSLFVSIPKPEGIELEPAQVPALFYMVDRACQDIQAPKFDQILLTQEFNAAVVQIPRLGLLGWYQQYLLLGLPLMQSLSVEHLQAVIAHELGHISKNHSRFSGWIYHQSMMWERILDRLPSINTFFTPVFVIFFNWYIPFFSAYSFVLRRRDEYEADRCAAALVGQQQIAEALIMSEVRSRLADSVWDEIYEQADWEMFPPKTAFTNLIAKLKCHLPAKSSDWLQEALTKTTNNADTHPCLNARLEALGSSRKHWETMLRPDVLETSAAEHLLGDDLQLFTSKFDRQWQSTVWSSWQQRYFYARNVRDRNVEKDE
jgi:Zn-dependent protease with chaperone function